VRVFEGVLVVARKGGWRRFLAAAAIPAMYAAVTATAIFVLTQLRASGVDASALMVDPQSARVRQPTN